MVLGQDKAGAATVVGHMHTTTTAFAETYATCTFFTLLKTQQDTDRQNDGVAKLAAGSHYIVLEFVFL